MDNRSWNPLRMERIERSSQYSLHSKSISIRFHRDILIKSTEEAKGTDPAELSNAKPDHKYYLLKYLNPITVQVTMLFCF